MKQSDRTSDGLFSLFRRLFGRLATALERLVRLRAGYHPERHYMRGGGKERA